MIARVRAMIRVGLRLMQELSLGLGLGSWLELGLW